MLWSNTAYCVKLSGEDLSRYSNKIESVVLGKNVRIITILLTKWRHNNKHCQSLPRMITSWRENSWHRYGEEITSLSAYV